MHAERIDRVGLKIDVSGVDEGDVFAPCGPDTIDFARVDASARIGGKAHDGAELAALVDRGGGIGGKIIVDAGKTPLKEAGTKAFRRFGRGGERAGHGMGNALIVRHGEDACVTCAGNELFERHGEGGVADGETRPSACLEVRIGAAAGDSDITRGGSIETDRIDGEHGGGRKRRNRPVGNAKGGDGQIASDRLYLGVSDIAVFLCAEMDAQGRGICGERRALRIGENDTRPEGAIVMGDGTGRDRCPCAVGGKRLDGGNGNRVAPRVVP